MMGRTRVVAALFLVVACSEAPDRALPTAPGPSLNLSAGDGAKRYVVVFNGSNGLPNDVAKLVTDAGGAISTPLPQIGALEATSSDPGFAAKVARSPGVSEVSEDVEVQMIPRSFDVSLIAVADASGTPGPSEPPGPDNQAGGSEPLYNQQWDKMRMNATNAGSYAVQRGNEDVVVAILDTGVEITHPDIVPNLDVARSRSFVPGENFIDDQNGHGSWCASAVAAPINEFGISGVAPGVTIVGLKVLRRTGSGNIFWLAAALVYSGEQKFDVASMSLSGLLRHAAGNQALVTLMHRAVQFARANGVTPIAALGNDLYDVSDGNFFRDFIVYPAEISGVIGVSATGYYNWKAYYSNFGTGKSDVSAPGGDQAFQRPNPALYRGLGGAIGAWAPETIGQFGMVQRDEYCSADFGCHYYAYIQGTSMATPNAAGVAALIISQYGDFSAGDQKSHMSPTKVESILQRTANNQPCPEPNSQTYRFLDPGPPPSFFFITSTCKGEAGGYTNYFGKGIVDALKAVTAGPGSDAAKPTVSATLQ